MISLIMAGIIFFIFYLFARHILLDKREKEIESFDDSTPEWQEFQKECFEQDHSNKKE